MKFSFCVGSSYRYGGDVIKWLKQMYACCQNKTAREEWPQRLQEMKDRLGPEDSDIYLYLVGLLLALAAEEEDKDTFTWLLDQEKYMRFCLFPASRKLRQLERVMIWNDQLSWISFDHFVTQKEEYLDEIFKRRGVLRAEGPANRIDLRLEKYGKKVSVSLPEPYIALLTGNLHMAEYFQKRNGYGRGVYNSELGDLKGIFRMFDYGFRGYHRRYSSICDGAEKRLDVLTAALFSGSYEMVGWVLKRFADIPWGGFLKNCIMWADRRTTKLIWQYHPELPGYFSAWDVLMSRNVILLKAFLEECSRTGRDAWEELAVVDLQMLAEESYDVLAWRTETTLFYRYAFFRLPGREAGRRLLRMMFAEPGFRANRWMLQMFREHWPGMEDDFTDYLNVHMGLYTGEAKQRFKNSPIRKINMKEIVEENPKGYVILRRLFEQKEGRFPVDLYRIPGQLWKSDSESVICGMLGILAPIRLENRVDELSREILRLGSERLMRKAVQEGFVTAVNIPVLLAEAGRLQCGNEIRVRLMGVPCGESLAERYRQGEEVPYHETEGNCCE